MLVLKPQSVQFFRAPQEIRSGKRGNGKKLSRIIRCGINGEAAPMGQKTKYSDGPFEKVFMTLFARKMEKFANAKEQRKSMGWWDFLYDYERFVDVSKRVMQGKNRMQQQLVVREVLLSMLPPGAPAQFRKLFPPTKWACEFNASITVPFFQWLVGPSELLRMRGFHDANLSNGFDDHSSSSGCCKVSGPSHLTWVLESTHGSSVQHKIEVVEVEINGIKQRSGVHIKKCRYLENSGCVGMCVNMCKIPTQDFFTNEFGLPLTMNPNFEDMSCEMIYGQVPLPFEDDPVSNQPCYKDICSMANPSSSLCPKLQA